MNDENTLEIIEQARRKVHETVDRRFDDLITCLLYTSDAADDSVLV